MFSSSIAGLITVLDPQTLLFMLMGNVVGLINGFLPGLGGTTTLVILMPFVYNMAPAQAFSFLIGGHVAATFGGAITAVLFNVPGTSQNIATCFDGYPMAQKGQAARAISIAGTASLLGGFFGAAVLTLSMPIMKQIILFLGSAEYFVMALLGLTIIALLSAKSLLKGLISGCLGLLCAFIGFDPVTGILRFDFGIMYLWDGIKFIPVVIGLFAIAQMFELYTQGGSIAKSKVAESRAGVLQGIKDCFIHWKVLLQASAIGTLIGTIPGVGGTVSNVLAYGYALETSKTPEIYGTGAPEGIIAPEASNNAKEGGALIPTLAFGIPGSEAMAILMIAFLIVGINPGPTMITEHLDLVFVLVWTIVIGNIYATVIGISFANQLTRLTNVKGSILIPFILVICFMGAFAMRQNVIDVFVAVIFGFIGYYMKKANYSPPAFVIGMVLAVVMERNLQVSLRAFDGWKFMYHRPITLFLSVLVIFILIMPYIRKLRKKGNHTGGQTV